VVIVVAGGPSWTDIVTAVGTVSTAIVAVGIAIASGRQTRKQVEEEHKRSTQQIKDERAYGREQLEEERRLDREKQQLAEAYQVQVVLGERAAGQPVEGTDKRDDSVKELAVLVVNYGSFTITDVEARFCYDGQKMASPARSKRLTGFGTVNKRVQGGFSPSAEHALDGVLTPRDAGVRFESERVAAQVLAKPYPLVRWTDRWGTRWEHRQGQVTSISKDRGWP
jgi:hypothetical protein